MKCKWPDTDSFAGAMLQFMFVQAGENFKMDKNDMQEAYLKDVLTSNDAVPMNELPGYPIPANFAGTCYVRVPWSVPKDLCDLVHERVSWVQSFEKRLSLSFKIEMSPFLGTSQPLSTDRSALSYRRHPHETNPSPKQPRQSPTTSPPIRIL